MKKKRRWFTQLFSVMDIIHSLIMITFSFLSLYDIKMFLPVSMAIVLNLLMNKILFQGCPLTLLDMSMRGYDRQSCKSSIVYNLLRIKLNPFKTRLLMCSWLLFSITTLLILSFNIEFFKS